MQSHKKDVGSPAVQAGILTERIKELTEHSKLHKGDLAAKRSILQMVGRRKKLLKYLAETDSQSYLTLIKKLGLRR